MYFPHHADCIAKLDSLWGYGQVCLFLNCAGVLINKFSDHQPCFMLLNAETKKSHTPNLVKLKVITQDALFNIHNYLMMTNIHEKLDQSPSADVNSNDDIMFNEIYRVVEKHISSKTVKFNKYKHKKSKWITHGVIKSIKYRDELYKILKNDTACICYIHHTTN